ncbi:MAG: hypothetical protein JSW03_07060 [Candidatus Eiseniibacteriota bacterium]|nr:MAG: hypothetical protein JSW03_07060 [Candidatus Eisenbacteria bacterium]
MKPKQIWIFALVLAVAAAVVTPSSPSAKEVVRPEEIKSMRVVVYDPETYAKLAELWKEYYDQYPSEYAYANWMYAARYAKDKNYSTLLAKGVKEYPANPTLLYLKATEHPGAHEDLEGRKFLERAIAIDPNYTDPWFSLVIHYMDSGDMERLDLALRRLLESGVITDEVMDLNYNMLVGLEKDAIVITNGDNDTYPGWILTRILNVRPDVNIVNRSLLNTEWYPLYVIERGLPRFIGKTELEDLRESILQELKRKKTGPSAGGPFGDTLIVKIVESAKRAGRPVYFAKTLYPTEELKKLAEDGRELGLVTLVTPSQASYADQLRKMYRTWVETFRTGGLQSWRLRNAPATDAGRMLTLNYAAGAMLAIEPLKEKAPELRGKLFQWYVQNVEQLISEEFRHKVAQAWCCGASDVKEIAAWCKEQGLECKKQ